VATPYELFDWPVRYLDVYLFCVYGRTCVCWSAACDVESIVAVLAGLVSRRHSTELQMTAAKWCVFPHC